MAAASQAAEARRRMRDWTIRNGETLSPRGSRRGDSLSVRASSRRRLPSGRLRLSGGEREIRSSRRLSKRSIVRWRAHLRSR